MFGKRYPAARFAIGEQVVQKCIESVDDLFHQRLHFLVTDPAQAMPSDLSIRADHTHVAVVTRLGTWKHAGVQVLKGRVPHTIEGQHLGHLCGRLLELWVMHGMSYL